MLKCKDIVDQASDYLEHEMTFGRRFQYRTHLFICRHCRRFSRQFSAGVVMTRQLPKSTASKHQIDAILGRIDELG